MSGHSIGPSVRLRVHQVLHVIPPAPHDGMTRQQVALVVVAQLEHGKQMHVLFVEEDRVVVDARFAAATAASSGQISSWRRLYSAVVPGLSFMRNAWFICRLVSTAGRGCVGIEVTGIRRPDALARPAVSARIRGAQALDHHARERIRAVFVVMRLVAAFIGEGARRAVPGPSAS